MFCVIEPLVFLLNNCYRFKILHISLLFYSINLSSHECSCIIMMFIILDLFIVLAFCAGARNIRNLNLKSTNPTKSRNKNNCVFDIWKQNARNAQWNAFKMKKDFYCMLREGSNIDIRKKIQRSKRDPPTTPDNHTFRTDFLIVLTNRGFSE